MICNLISSSASAFYLLIGTELAAILELTQAIVCLFFVENKTAIGIILAIVI